MRATLVALAIFAALAPSIAVSKKAPIPPQYVVVRKLPPEIVLQRMQLYCMQSGLAVEQTTATQITCSKPMDDSFRSLLYRALATPNYATNPVFYFQVTAIRMGDNTTISAREYMKYQNAYGQETNEPVTNRKELESVGAGLQSMKVKWEAKLLANGDDEAATIAAADEGLAKAGGVLTNQPAAAPAVATSTSNALDHPSSSAAMQSLAQFQCTDSFRLVGESAGKTLFEAKCKGGSTQLVQCSGMDCKPLQ